VRRGRGFTAQDTAGTDRVAVISESTARTQFGTDDALGKHIQISRRDDARPWAIIVGIVGDVHQYGLDTKPEGAVYVLFAQFPMQGYASLVVRSRIPVDRIESAVREAMLAVDRNQPVFHLQPMSRYIALSMAQRTFALTIVMAFGLLALTLAVAGVYGVTSFVVEQRRREVALRLALGATPAAVVQMMCRQVLAAAAVGVIIGFATVSACGKVVSTVLFNVSPVDLGAHGAVALASSRRHGRGRKPTLDASHSHRSGPHPAS
jgi:putative ABC transport system permease protein